MKKRKKIHFVVALLSVIASLGVLGLCGWIVVVQPLGKAVCVIRPDSLRNPPTPPNAYNIQFGKSSFAPEHGFEGKLIQFETGDSPAKVYDFYQESLGKDGWLEDTTQYHGAMGANLVDTKFDWECALEGLDFYAHIWFHSEVVALGKTVVTLNSEYLP